ncbi:hypothetical protein BDR07DRAFT_1383807 [Suillus spraguei]|nr:hypothetical protein BDR07DRAFT_1383807 [Suillus spraguei]
MSEPKRLMHPLHIVLNVPSTADMTFITAGGAVTFYPELTRDYQTVKTMSRENIKAGERLGSVGKERFYIHPDMSFLNGPCNVLCPVLWHHLLSQEDYIAVDWDQRFSTKSVLYDNNIECMVNNRDIPPMIMLYHPPSIRKESKHIDEHELVRLEIDNKNLYEKTFKGLLYTTMEQISSIHSTSLKLTIGKQPQRTLDTFPNSLTLPDDIYTIFLEQCNNYAAPNALLMDITPNAELNNVIKVPEQCPQHYQYGS